MNRNIHATRVISNAVPNKTTKMIQFTEYFPVQFAPFSTMNVRWNPTPGTKPIAARLSSRYNAHSFAKVNSGNSSRVSLRLAQQRSAERAAADARKSAAAEYPTKAVEYSRERFHSVLRAK